MVPHSPSFPRSNDVGYSRPETTKPELTRQPDTQRAFNSLGEELNALSNLATRLHDRLESVCRPAGPAQPSNERACASSCKLSAEIDNYADRIRCIRETLDDIESRLEV